jgi:hypothetical protein
MNARINLDHQGATVVGQLGDLVELIVRGLQELDSVNDSITPVEISHNMFRRNNVREQTLCCHPDYLRVDFAWVIQVKQVIDENLYF